MCSKHNMLYNVVVMLPEVENINGVLFIAFPFLAAIELMFERRVISSGKTLLEHYRVVRSQVGKHC